MATTPVQNLPILGRISDGNTLVGEKVPGVTGLITVESILYDDDFHSSQGLMTTTAPGVYANRTIEGVAGRTTVTDGAGTLGNPIVDISATYAGQQTITTLGTVTVGTWEADIVEMEFGGTSKNLTPSNGGIVYTDADSMEILAGTPTARQMLQSGANSAPAWSTATYPATTTINGILYSTANNVVGEIATANNGVLTTNAAGVPSITTNLHTGITIGGQYIYRATGTDVSLADGGTGTSLTAPGADRFMFYDQSASSMDWLVPNSTLVITGTTVGVNFSTVGTIASGTWNGNSIGTLYGGTGFSGGYTNGQLLIGNGVGGGLNRATLTSSNNSITITNGPGTIDIIAASTSTIKTAFKAKLSSTQSLATGTNTKINYNSEIFDSGNWFTGGRYTPLVSGKYLVQHKIFFDISQSMPAGNLTLALIYKNGVQEEDGVFFYTSAAGQYVGATSSTIVSMNGTTDYLEAYGFQSSGASKSVSNGSFFAVLLEEN